MHTTSTDTLPVTQFDWDMQKLKVIPMSFKTSEKISPKRMHEALQELFDVYPVLTSKVNSQSRTMALGEFEPDLKVFEVNTNYNFDNTFRVDCPKAVSKSDAFSQGKIPPVTFELYQLKSGGSFFCAWQSHMLFDGTSGIWLLQELGHIYNSHKHMLKRAVYPMFDWTQLVPPMKQSDVDLELARYGRNPTYNVIKPGWFDFWCVGDKSRRTVVHYPEAELRELSKKAGSHGSRYIGLTCHVTNILSEYFGWTEVDAQHILGLRGRSLPWYPNMDVLCNGFFGTTIKHADGKSSVNELSETTEVALADADELDRHAMAYVQRQCASAQGRLPPFYPDVPEVDEKGMVTSGTPFLIFSGMHTVQFDSFEDASLHQFAAVVCTIYAGKGGSGLDVVLGLPSDVSFGSLQWQKRLHTFL